MFKKELYIFFIFWIMTNAQQKSIPFLRNCLINESIKLILEYETMASKRQMTLIGFYRRFKAKKSAVKIDLEL